jgi:hypothetical protein
MNLTSAAPTGRGWWDETNCTTTAGVWVTATLTDWAMLTEHRRGSPTARGAGKVWDGLALHRRAAAVREGNRALFLHGVKLKFVPHPFGEVPPKPAVCIGVGDIERGLPLAIIHNCNYALTRWNGWSNGFRRNRYWSGFRLNRSDRKIQRHLRRSLP